MIRLFNSAQGITVEDLNKGDDLMPIKTFLEGFSLDIANITICDSNYDLLLAGTIHFYPNDDYRYDDLGKLADRIIESWFVNLRGEIFIIVKRNNVARE